MTNLTRWEQCGLPTQRTQIINDCRNAATSGVNRHLQVATQLMDELIDSVNLIISDVANRKQADYKALMDQRTQVIEQTFRELSDDYAALFVDGVPSTEETKAFVIKHRQCVTLITARNTLRDAWAVTNENDDLPEATMNDFEVT